jgi:patatin-like phospholipase/acyl hydrolase
MGSMTEPAQMSSSALVPAGPSQLPTVPTPRSLRILSLDGGDIKGYTTLLILQRIFRQLKNALALAEEPKPCEVFDLIVGTPTGELIAVMLGRLQMTIDDCLFWYEKLGEKVFGRRPLGRQSGRLVKELTNSPLYDITLLKEAIEDVLKDKKMPLDTKLLTPYRPEEH